MLLTLLICSEFVCQAVGMHCLFHPMQSCYVLSYNLHSNPMVFRLRSGIYRKLERNVAQNKAQGRKRRRPKKHEKRKKLQLANLKNQSQKQKHRSLSLKRTLVQSVTFARCDQPHPELLSRNGCQCVTCVKKHCSKEKHLQFPRKNPNLRSPLRPVHSKVSHAIRVYESYR